MTRLISLVAAVAALAFSLMVLAAPASAQTEDASAVRGVPEYRLGSGDKVRVITFGEEGLGGEFYVSASGKIAMPLIGEIPAAGLTTREFQSLVEQALRDQDYLRNPRVSAEVLNYRPFYILGEVNKPGTYPYTNGLTVQNAVATAEGYTYRANQKKVFIKRAGSATEQELPLTAIIEVAPGDTIRIAERFF